MACPKPSAHNPQGPRAECCRALWMGVASCRGHLSGAHLFADAVFFLLCAACPGIAADAAAAAAAVPSLASSNAMYDFVAPTSRPLRIVTLMRSALQFGSTCKERWRRGGVGHRKPSKHGGWIERTQIGLREGRL